MDSDPDQTPVPGRPTVTKCPVRALLSPRVGDLRALEWRLVFLTSADSLGLLECIHDLIEMLAVDDADGHGTAKPFQLVTA